MIRLRCNREEVVPILGGGMFVQKGPFQRVPRFHMLGQGAREWGRILRKDVFLPSKNLLAPSMTTFPFKNPFKNLVFTDNSYRRLLETLLRNPCF